MFKFFRKILGTNKLSRKNQQSKTLSDENILKIIKDTFSLHDDTVSALFLVAYENFPVYWTVFAETENVGNDYGASLERFAKFLEDSMRRASGGSIEDEINSRRFFYLYIATLLKTIQLRAKNKPELWDEISSLWVILLPGARALSKTISRTHLWTEDETVYFQDIKTEDDGENYCLTIMAPEEVKDNKKIRDWKERKFSAEEIAKIREMERLMHSGNF